MQLPSIFRRKSSSGSSDLLDKLTAYLWGTVSSKSGVEITRETALRTGALFACLRVISQGCAQVPFKLMRESKSAVSIYPQRLSATDHPLYDLLHRRPNSWQTSYELRETMLLHAALTGSAFVFINRVQIGGVLRIVELIPLNPGRVTYKQNADWSISYKVTGSQGQVQDFAQESIWHLRGPSYDGVGGLDIMGLAREALGLAISTESSQALLHKNGVQSSGEYSVPEKLSAEQYEKLKKYIQTNNAEANRHGVMILDHGAKFTPRQMTGVDAQHLETRRHQIEEVCRFMGVMPIMVGYSDKSQTYASAEQMFLAHLTHCLMPWYERIQQSADVNLLTQQERQAGYYTKLIEAGLIRGDLKTQGEYFYRTVAGGIMARNEARGLMDLNPIAGLDEPLTPTNMTTDPSGAPAGDPAK